MATVKYRELLKQLRADGWEVVVIRGSHRQLKHPAKRGRVTVGRMTAARSYLVVIERGERNYSAHVPDLPGCIATGRSREETIERMRDAIRLHLDGMRADGQPIPEPVTSAALVAA
jgi:predicted RNase H-like HicB family nuclease/predicted RNA binding protein YcfA (HicA-like mRNA interferase family)